jgi:hypothetical protein
MHKKLTPDERTSAERQIVQMKGQIRSLINSDLPEDELGANWEDVLQESILLQRKLRDAMS